MISSNNCDPDATSLTDAISEHSMNEDELKILVFPPSARVNSQS